MSNLLKCSIAVPILFLVACIENKILVTFELELTGDVSQVFVYERTDPKYQAYHGPREGELYRSYDLPEKPIGVLLTDEIYMYDGKVQYIIFYDQKKCSRLKYDFIHQDGAIKDAIGSNTYGCRSKSTAYLDVKNFKYSTVPKYLKGLSMNPVYEFNEKGQIEEFSFESRSSKSTRTFTTSYRYDDQGNWITRRFHEGDKIVHHTARRIMYAKPQN